MIKEALHTVKQHLPSHVLLVAVSKTKPISFLNEAYKAGQRIFGENKALELAQKQGALPKDIQWHYIGYLQTNKVKYIASFVSLIHSVDRFKILNKINSEAIKNHRIIRVLLQFHIAKEESKFGFSIDSVENMFKSNNFNILKNIEIVGVMGMATFTRDTLIVRNEFKNLKIIFDHLKNNYFKDSESFSEISMGMSGDYLTAIEEGSTIIRVGSSIFGSR